ncbi:sensor histidine kinase [Flexistipes sinusarabici]|nr:HAMP domain-containing sensor histidine kinase [Flexistipes sinusarabici]
MQKLENIGLLACKVAHDFNNILTVIGSCADYISVDCDDSEKSMANEILKSVDSASMLTNSLLNYGKSASLKDEFFDMNRLICNSETIFRQFLEEDIDLIIDNPNEEAFVYADYSKIQHALINLIVNARDAVNSADLSVNKTIKITVCRKNKSELLHDFSFEVMDEYENYVVLIVEDNGQGINDFVRENLFEPFFTTKTSDAGSGLGLASVKDIVKQYDGKIFFESEKDKGTAFYLVLLQAY